jgi:hypothetical protein
MNPLKTYKNILQLPQVGKPAQRTGSEISNNSCPRLSRQLLYSPCKCNEVEFKWEYLVGPPYFFTNSKVIIRINLVNPYIAYPLLCLFYH